MEYVLNDQCEFTMYKSVFLLCLFRFQDVGDIYFEDTALPLVFAAGSRPVG